MLAEVSTPNILLTNNVAVFIVIPTPIVGWDTHNFTSFPSLMTRIPAMFLASLEDRCHIATYCRDSLWLEDLDTVSQTPSLGVDGWRNLT
jgi:hypothetical protein